MDDCNLQKLSLKPGKLSPAFNKDHTEYNVTVASDVDKVIFDCLTSDTGASYCISGSDGGRTVPLKEGQVNDIKIEVGAEDGTIKNYFVRVRRLSPSDATLGSLTLENVVLTPEFDPGVTEYSCTAACDVSKISITPTVPDTKTAVTVNNEKPGSDIGLNVGWTIVELKVTSADGKNEQVYTVNIARKPLPRYVKFKDPLQTARFECPVSLAAMYQPVSVKGSQPLNTYSGPTIDLLTRTSKIDPLSELPLDKEWRVENHELDKEMSESLAYVPLSDGGTSETVKMSDIGGLLKQCNQMPKLPELSCKYESNCPLKHTSEIRSWEKHLQQIFDESNAMKLSTSAENSLKQYYSSLPQPGQKLKYSEGESPIDYLQQAIYCYATAIKNKPKDANLHLKLGMVLEEKYYAEDTMGLKKEKDGFGSAGANIEARESSKSDDCDAICQLRGVEAGAPLSLQLKAIDQEYHSVLDSGQSQKADHVQALYAWKSKQATQEGAAAQKASDDDSSLGQAYLKYLDALSLDESKAPYHFHVGRMLVVQGLFDEAIPRLEATLSWSEKHQMAKFYLGLALTLRKEGSGTRTNEAVVYLTEGMECLLHLHTEWALSPEVNCPSRGCLQAEDLLRSDNVYVLRGIIQLARVLQVPTDIKNVMASSDILHTAALLCSETLLRVSKGDTYQQLEWVQLEAHSLLLDQLSASQKENVKTIGQRCQRLSALIKHSSIPQNSSLLQLQQKTCRTLVEIQPCSSHALYLLGNAQLTEHNNDPQGTCVTELLDSAKQSFLAAIGMEGKPATGTPLAELTGQKWWQDRLKEAEAKKAESNPSAKPGSGKPGSAKGTAGRGGAAATPARGGGRGAAAATARGGGRGASTPARGGAQAAAGRGGAAGRGVAAARGGTQPARGAAAAGRGAAKPLAKTGAAAPSKPAATTTAAKSGSATKRPASASKRPSSASQRPTSAAKAAPKDEPAVINKKTYHPRLGLAQAYSKTEDTLSESLRYYKEVIAMAPELHDAYIESAEMIVKTDPMAAVDIYCKFPVSENLTFDDAYIFGEIVRLLMKAEQFDDPRLELNSISLGKVMGIGSLEKYVNILDAKFKTDLLKRIYAGVNGKDVDDPDIQAFFKFKCWI